MMRNTGSLVTLGLLLGGLQLGASGAAFTEGQEQLRAALTRDSGSGFSLQTQVSKNEYRYVERTESYVVQVPYDVQVPYRDEETYYENETRCGLVPRTREVCHNEERCEQVPRQVCHEESRCERASLEGLIPAEASTVAAIDLAAARGGAGGGHQGGGNNNGGGAGNGGGHQGGGGNNGGGANNGGGHQGGGGNNGGGANNGGGGHQGGGGNNGGGAGNGGGHQGGGNNGGGANNGGGQTCHNENKCETTSERVCRPKRECRNESFTENVCQTVSVPRTRMVLRYRTVTQYRPEERVRTVTDKFFDHAWGTAVTVVLPPEAALAGSESESILVQLAGDESNPDALVSIDSPIFSYRVASRDRIGDMLIVTMEMVAKYAAADLGSQTVSRLALVNAGNGYFEVRFTDAGQVARVSTTYRVQVIDRNTNQVAFETALTGSIGVRNVVIPVTTAIESADDHLVKLDVSREGIVLAQPVAFEQTAEQLAQLDPAPYIDVNGVREFAVAGVGAGAVLLFTDVAPNASVDTVYDITIQEKVWGFLWESTIAHAVFDRAQLSNVNGKVGVPVNAFPGLDPRKLDSRFSGGSSFLVKITVTRTSERLKGYSPITLTKQAALKIASQGRRGD